MSSFVKNIDDILKMRSQAATFYDAEILTVYWETKPEVIKRLLPAPLQPAAQPLVHAFVANYPRTSFSLPYREAGLFILADYQGKLGTYCLSMPITDDMAMGLGRELYGFPKKLAQIELHRDGNQVTGTVQRHGVEFFRVQVQLTEKYNTADAQALLSQTYGPGLPIFNVKYSRGADGNSFDLNPQLIKQHTSAQIQQLQLGTAMIGLEDSRHDPWAELEVVRVLGGVYTVGEAVLLRGEVLAELEPGAFLPYSFLRWDWWETTPRQGGNRQ